MTMKHVIKHALFAVGYGITASMLIVIGVYIYLLQNRAELKPWHLTRLDAEFRAELVDSGINDLDDYRNLEALLFEQLHERVYQRLKETERLPMNRYNTESVMNPENFRENWNHTFELANPNPRAGVLLLHGLSDSPYSMKTLGQILHRQNYWVIGLRLPGHGTAPSGLLKVTWQDFSAAVRLAVHHLRDKIGPDRPLYIVGYSNGAALAVEYSLAAMEDEKLSKADALVLLSPAIDVTPIAALAVWQERLSHLSGLEKLAWSDIQPEFDPYKYNSFTVNAGNQIYRLTSNIAERMQRLAESNGLKSFPRTLAFVSIVDATIPPVTLIDALFSKLPTGEHQLVIFDVNRNTQSAQLLRADPDTLIRRLLEQSTQPYQLTLLTNATSDSDRLVARNRAAHSDVTTTEALNLAWPKYLFSLSHVALPFPPDDPIYGGQATANDGSRIVTLGSIWIRGERNLLQIPDNYFLRLRYNPFFPYLKDRTLAFLDRENQNRTQRR